MKIYINPNYTSFGIEAGIYDATEAPTVENIWKQVAAHPERFGEHENICFLVPVELLTDWEFPDYVDVKNDHIEIRVSEDMATAWRVEGISSDWKDLDDDQTLEELNQILFSSLSSTDVVGITADNFAFEHSLYVVGRRENGTYGYAQISQTNLAWDRSSEAAHEIAEKANELAKKGISFSLRELAEEICNTYEDGWRGDPEHDSWAHTTSAAHVCEVTPEDLKDVAFYVPPPERVNTRRSRARR